MTAKDLHNPFSKESLALPATKDNDRSNRNDENLRQLSPSTESTGFMSMDQILPDKETIFVDIDDDSWGVLGKK